jgi:imidazolonepropionase-like amidohydrolase
VKLLLLLALFALTLPMFSQNLAIVDVTVVDTQTGALTPHRTVVVRDGRIRSVDNAPPPKDAIVVPARGKFLIPGLWDMVTHLSWTRASALPALVANGVTAVRDEGGDLRELAIWADGVRSGRLVGPTIFQVGPMLNGKSFNRYQYALGSPEQARATVRLLKFEGVDGLEIERRVPRDVYFSLMQEANGAGLPVGGKVPIEVTPIEASNAGQATIDNLETIYDGVFRTAHPNNVAEGIDAFLEADGASGTLLGILRANGTAVTPCVSAFADAIARANRNPDQCPNYRYVAKSQRVPLRPMSASDLKDFQAMLPRLQKTIAKLQTNGVTLLAGSDIAADRIPGFSLQDELKALGTAGLTPLQVLQTATLNPAKVMGRSADYGSVVPGKIADLLLLDEDPAKDVAALQQINAIVLHGRLLRRSALDDQLRLAIQLADQN